MLKLIVNTRELESSLKKLEVIIPNKPEIEILAGIKLSATDDGVLKLTSSDLKNTIVTTLDVNLLSKGDLVLTGLKDIMKSIKFFTEFNTEFTQISDKMLEIRNGDKKLKLQISDIRDYPEFKIKEFTDSYDYNESDLYNRIMKINYARYKSQERPNLTGINFNKQHLTTLDG